MLAKLHISTSSLGDFMTPEQIAKVVQAAEDAFLNLEQKKPAQGEVVAAVKDAVAKKEATPFDLHSTRVAEKMAGGWTAGETFDLAAKEDPGLMPYDQLPLELRLRGHLFLGIVRALTSLDVEPPAPLVTEPIPEPKVLTADGIPADPPPPILSGPSPSPDDTDPTRSGLVAL